MPWNCSGKALPRNSLTLPGATFLGDWWGDEPQPSHCRGDGAPYHKILFRINISLPFTTTSAGTRWSLKKKIDIDDILNRPVYEGLLFMLVRPEQLLCLTTLSSPPCLCKSEGRFPAQADTTCLPSESHKFFFCPISSRIIYTAV